MSVKMDLKNELGRNVNTARFEKEEQELARKYIEEDDIVLELGARYGSVSCIINSKLRCKTNQVSVEPDERVWSSLERNKKANKCEFHIINWFISNKKLDLTDINSVYGYGTSSIENSESTIPSFTLDQIKDTYKLNFNVLVADCEGFLETFFDENPSFYDGLRMIMFEADCPHKCNYNKIRSALKEKGFIETLGGFQNVWMRV